VRLDGERLQQAQQSQACFVLGSQSEAEQRSDAEGSAGDKGQAQAEGGCRCLKDPLFFVASLGFDHGVGHSLLLLYDAKALHSQKSKEFKGLGHYHSNTLHKFIINYNILYHLYNYLIFLHFF